MDWKYKTVEFRRAGMLSSDVDWAEVEQHLNTLGKIGWEVVSCIKKGMMVSSGVVVLLKRSSKQ